MRRLIPLSDFARSIASKLLAAYRRSSSTAPQRPCHYQELFVKSNGDVFPCCLTWNRKSMVIGHITDFDLTEKIMTFSRICSCERYRLRKADVKDRQNYSILNLGLSLACQANCIMCRVNAPSWREKYEYYTELEEAS